MVNIPTPANGGTGDQIAAIAGSYAQTGTQVTINIPSGTYYLHQSIVMSNNITISGAGPSTIIQLPASPNGIAAFTSYSGADMTIQNLVMDGGIPRGAFLLCCGGNSNPYTSTGVNMYSTSTSEVNVTLSNLEIRNFRLGLFMGTVNGLYISNVYMHDNNPVAGFAHNAYLVACDNVTITHSRFNDAHTGDGLHIDFGGANTTITKSEFSGNNGIGILSQQNVNVTMSSTRTDFNTNDGIQIDAAGLNLLTNEGSYNGGYGFNIPDTLDGNGHLNGYWGYGDAPDIGYFYQSSIANITGNGYPTSPNFYEAEQADGVLGVNDTADWTTSYAGFSGVGAVDFNANHILIPGQLTFSHVGAVTAGSYPLTLRYSNGSGATQTMSLTVNGVAQGALSFPATASNASWSTINFTAPLQVGNNVVQIGVVGSAAPEIDYLQVNTSATGSAPAAPTGVTATAVDPYTVTLTWQASPIAATYNVYQNGRLMAVNLVASTYTDKKIYFGNSTVTYSVQAVNQYGASTTSSATVTTPIDSPAGFQNSSGSAAGSYFQWMSANGAASYNLKRSAVSGGPYATVASIPNTTSLGSSNYEQTGQDATATPGTTHYYVVTAVDGNGYESATATYELAATAQLPTQSITFNPIPAQAAGISLTLTATASSGLPVSYTVVPNGNCSVSGSVVTFLNIGNCGVIALQPGNSAYAAAAPVGQVIVVNRYATATPYVGYVGFWAVNNSGVTISWSTDIPATTFVAYGTSNALGQTTPVQSALTNNHGVVLTGLSPGTTYYFRALSAAGGNTGQSDIYSFTTTGQAASTAPYVGYVGFWGVNSSGVTISWSTDVAANTQVAYGTTTALGQLTPLQNTLTNSHGVTLTGLLPSTTYYFEAQSTDVNGNTGYSTLYSFTTTPGGQ